MQGNFTMAGVRFWPEMKGLDEEFLAKTSRFKHIVPVFTNVIFDTSQVHANTLFRRCSHGWIMPAGVLNAILKRCLSFVPIPMKVEPEKKAAKAWRSG